MVLFVLSKDQTANVGVSLSGYALRWKESRTQDLLGLVKNIGPSEKDAWLEVDRQRLRENANQYQPFRGNPKTYGQLCQHYIENELQEDQSDATIEKAYTTAQTYKRILNKRVIPRFGRESPWRSSRSKSRSG